MTEKIRCALYSIMGIALGIVLLLPGGHVQASEKKTIYNSSYVSFSPDGEAWTTCAGDRNYKWYDENETTTVYTGIKSSLETLREGEHYYKSSRSGEVPIGAWKVTWRRAQCIHNAYGKKPGWHGISFGMKKCHRYYYSGWKPLCADCGEPIEWWNIYMSREAAETIQYMDLGSEENPVTYYYLCPFCSNLEQGVTFSPHRCKTISNNQYRIIYDANAESCHGFMEESYHMYDNAVLYEGKEVTPVTHLVVNNYSRIGYVFTGWNTRPDGSGISYGDRAEIYNLSTADYKDRTTWTEEDNGTVILYAQWRPCKSTLKIDAAGGSYNGESVFSVTGEYQKKYALQEAHIEPPEGCLIKFETNGGTPVAPVRGTNHFEEWMRILPFRGQIDGGSYIFPAADGHTDTVKAVYQPDPITLPFTSREGWSFGGWYYDTKFTQPAGAPGDRIIPSASLTLYAHWVTLQLQSTDNYRANKGKGAVDLTWSQADQKDKSYLLFQKRENGAWIRVNTADDISNAAKVNKKEEYAGKEKTFLIPYTGLYTITAKGAQGQNYESNSGGYGGSVTGTFWLQQGEKLTYFVGGQNGVNGGGSATDYGNGGGKTSVVSDRKGILLIAGGGGGASPAGNGGAGGSMAGVTENSDGQDGMAGGGAGYLGGSAGERIVHHHTNECYRDASYTPAFGNWQHFVYANDSYSNTYTATSVGGHTTDDNNTYHVIRAGWSRPHWAADGWNTSGYQGIDTRGNTKLNVSVYADSWGNGCRFSLNRSEYCILNQAGRIILSGTFRDAVYALSETPSSTWQNEDGSWGGAPGTSKFSGTFHFNLPEGTTKVYLHFKFYHDCSNAWFSSSLTGLNFTGGMTSICGYTEGQVLSSKPAYGGSNYVNEDCVQIFESMSGNNRGDGSVEIRSQMVGYQETSHLNGIVATDCALPDKIPAEAIYEAIDEKSVRVTWQVPKDNGTVYYHKAESYLTGSTVRLCESNITQNRLTSGIAGYYLVIDDAKDTNVTKVNGHFNIEPHTNVTADKITKYLHVAAVDVAGNIGATTHFTIKETEVPWKIYTGQLIPEGEDGNVAPSSEERCWYVRADGRTPITLKHQAYLKGVASLQYQLNETIYETRTQEGTIARNIIRTPSSDTTVETVRTDAEGLIYATEGTTVLQQYPYSFTVRSDSGKSLTGVQKFTITGDRSGQRIQVIPIAEADSVAGKIYSLHELDEKNKITLIADGEPPVIYGMEMLENRELIDRRDGKVNVTITASDAVSGVKEFYVNIQNTDNTVSKTYHPDADGSIRMEITEDDALFSGDFTVFAYACDQVGNETEISEGTTEFGLEADIIRIREPQDAAFRCGESGILTFTVWGYADRVEVIFPKEMTDLCPELNRIFDYRDKPGYRITEQLQFMVPLYTPENENFEVTVKAYKGDKKLEDHPGISVIGVKGSVLEDLRTRLR